MKASILIVEDDEDSRVYLSRALGASGYNTLTAANGVEALDVARETPPDLIISDIMMPEMDGFELCRKIKADTRLRTIPFIFYTATYLDNQNQELGLSLGATRYLTKPMEITQLLTVIEEVVSEAMAGAMQSGVAPLRGEQELDAMYREALARKLDKKVAELERTRNYLRNVFDCMPSSLIGVDNNANVLEWNGEADKRSEVSLIEAHGKPVWRLFPYLVEHSSRIRQSIETKQPLSLSRLRYEHKGSMGFIDLMVYPMLDDSNGAVIRIDDVTKSVGLEEAMIQTEKMLSVGILAAGMAHEINNPLSGITLGVQNIMRRILPEREKNIEAAKRHGIELDRLNAYLEDRDVLRMLNGIRDSAERAGDIVENMLHFSRKSGAAFEQNDLTVLIDQTLEMAALDYDLKQQYDFRNIRIEKNYGPGLESVPCIPAQIKQVLLNLFRNAAQAMHQQSIDESALLLQVSAYPHEGLAVIEVKDNGPGIEPAIQDKLFEPFFTTKPAGEGVGMGLFIAYYIVTDTHGGHVRVESEPGQGARFIIELPLERQT